MGNPVGMGQSYTFRIRVSYIPTSTELVLYRGQLGERTNPAESEKERARRAVVGGWMDCTTLAEAAVAVWIVRQ